MAEQNTLPRAIVDDQSEHAPFASWLKSRNFDVAIGSMSASANSKKPGRVLDRLRKKMKSPITGLRVIKWEKAHKFVYGVAYTKSTLREIVLHEEADLSGDWLDTQVLIQTDLYLHTKGDHTEGNAVTLASISQEVIDDAYVRDISWKEILRACRIFTTGIPHSHISPLTPHEFLFPCNGGAVVAINLPIERYEHGEKTISHMLDVRHILSDRELSLTMQERMEGLELAMSPDGNPGRSEFGDIVRRNAISLR